MNRKPDIYGDPNFDPHRAGKRGSWLGALGTKVLLGVLLIVGVIG